MAEFDLLIHDRGTSSLAPGSALRLHEARPLWRSLGGLLYSATLEGDSAPHYAALVPHHPNDDALSEVLAWVRRLSERVSVGLPALALATHPIQSQTVLILPYPSQSLAEALRDLLGIGQGLRAERLATQAALDYAALLRAMQDDEAPRSAWHIRARDLALDESGRLRLFAWLGARPADPPDEAAYLQHWARLWHESWLGHLPRLPLTPYDDTSWQARKGIYLPEGALSLGWRLLLAAAMQTPPETRYQAEDGRHAQLERALRAWNQVIQLSGSALEVSTTELLDDFMALLPRHYQRDSVRQAIWHDWLWRAQMGDTLPSARREGLQSARVQAFFIARSEDDQRASFLDRLRPLVSATDWGSAQALCGEWRRYQESLARSSYSPAWQEWGHTGRWEQLITWMSAYSERAEEAWAVGLALHRDPREDQIQSLNDLSQRLATLPDDRITRALRFEADLRGQLLTLRQQVPLTEWQTHVQALHATLHSVYNGDHAPPYLQMSEAMQGDNTAFFYTLLGRMVGTLADSLEPILSALRQGDLSVARWLMERAELLVTRPAEAAWLERALEPYWRLLDFLEAPLKQPNALPPLFHSGLELLALPDLSADADLCALIERRLLAIGAHAFALIQRATATRAWPDLRLAYPAARLHSESVSKEALERLASLHADQPRRLDYYDTLDLYRQLYTTSRDMLALAQSEAAWRLQASPAPDQAERLRRARATLELLRRANELGLPMDNFLDHDDSSRATWRLMLDDALRALSQLEAVSGDVAELKRMIGGTEGLPQRLQQLIDQVEALRLTVDNPDGESGALGVVQQLRALRLHLGELERTYQEQARALDRQMQQLKDETRGQMEVQDIQLKRQASQITGTGNLIEDARQRLHQLENRLTQGQNHEARQLMNYLGAMPGADSLSSVPAVLDAIDGLVYALRRCPTEAFNAACAQAWQDKFNSLRQRFDAMSAPTARLSRKERSLLKANLRSIRTMLDECDGEARQKAEAYRRINGSKPDSGEGQV